MAPSFRYVITNFNQPMPLPRKLWLGLRNAVLRLRGGRFHNCCGHPGEPGCCESHEHGEAVSSR